MTSFITELETLINKYSKENGSNTPDYILAEYLLRCLQAFDFAVNRRTSWYKPETERPCRGMNYYGHCNHYPSCHVPEPPK